MNRIDLNEWDDINSKFSHPDKTLRQHIEEVEDVLDKLLDFYDIKNPFIIKLTHYIARYHDMGKLHPSWSIDNKHNPSHSQLSVYWTTRSRKFFETDKKMQFILWHLILKHHTTINKRVPRIEADEISSILKNLVGEVDRVLESIDFDTRVNIVDSYGFFKIADVVSTQYNKFKGKLVKAPTPTYSRIERLFGNKIDRERYREQLKLTGLPDLALLRAYTGWGKTSSSTFFFVDSGVKKIFYLFPTITAINKFYNKVKNVFGDDKVSKYFYFYDAELKEDMERLQTLFYLRNFIIYPYNITTIDQFLLAFLQIGRYYIKRPMFRNSGIIVDEVHLLNPVILYLLTYFIRRYRDLYRFRILFMSATLPQALRMFLTEKLDISNNAFLDFSEGYRRRRRIKYILLDDDILSSTTDIIREYKKGKRVLVVVNTVDKAVRLAEDLVNEVGRDSVILIHGRFMYRDRRLKEDLIDKYKKPHILVSTQVCEVSLDISYDRLYTELASLSSLIQRFGRINRYGVSTDDVNTIIYKAEADAKYPYTEEDLKSSWEVLKLYEEDRLSNELELLKEFDEIYLYDKLIEIVNKESRRVNLKAFEERMKYYYSLEMSDTNLRKVLEYRESFTTLILPHPDSVEDTDIKEGINSLIETDFSKISYGERLNVLAEAKDYLVPVPVYWVYGSGEETVFRKGFPVVDFRDRIYNSYYGFRKMESAII